MQVNESRAKVNARATTSTTTKTGFMTRAVASTIELIPAILVKNRDELLRQINLVRPYLRTVQIDIMDNDFVPNKTIGLEELKDLPGGVKYEFHWMVQNPEKWISALKGVKNANGSLHIIHIESRINLAEVKKAVAAVHGTLGIALNPETGVERAVEYAGETNYFLAMTVHPGFSGQKYISEVEEKIKILRDKYPEYNIEVDGGINTETITRAVAAGANKIVAANAIFGQPDVFLAIKQLQQAAVKGRVA